MKIGLDARAISHPQRGGFRTYVEQLASALCQLDSPHELALIFDRSPSDAIDWRARFPRAETLVEGNAPRNVGVIAREQFALPRRLRSSGVDLAHFPTNTAPMFAGAPFVLTLHDTLVWSERPPFGARPTRNHVRRWGMFAYSYIASRLAVARAAIVIVPSEWVNAELMATANVRPRQVEVIHLAASPTFTPSDQTAEGEAVRAKHGLSGAFVFAFASASPRKNIGTLLDAFAALPHELREATSLVLLMADNVRRAAVLARADQLGIASRVRLVRSLGDADVAGLFRAASAFAFPSLREGFGLPPLEAMACGAPVLASRATSLPEVLGDAALLLDPLDTGAWTRALERALTDPNLRADLRYRGLQRAAQFSWARTAARTMAVYEQAFEVARTSGQPVKSQFR